MRFFMYCKKCWKKIDENWKYCPQCRNILNESTIETDKVKIIENQKKESKEAYIYIVVFLLGIIGLLSVKDAARGVFFLVSLISIVTGFIKCPNNNTVKILFWLFLTFVIIAIIFLIVLVFTCINEIPKYSCPGQ